MECDVVGFVPLPNVRGDAFGTPVTNTPTSPPKPRTVVLFAASPLPTPRAAQTNGDVEAPSSTINLTESGAQMRTNEQCTVLLVSGFL